MVEEHKNPIVFGTMLVDKLHMFFGKSAPEVAVVADMWAHEEDDEDVMVDHFRGHARISYANLRDTNRWAVLGVVDTKSNKTVREQCEEAEKKWCADNKEYIDARTEENERLLAEDRKRREGIIS
jgi:hypothetical protein